MKNRCFLPLVVLLAAGFILAGCGSPAAPPNTSKKSASRRATQTGSYIPRERAAASDRDARPQQARKKAEKRAEPKEKKRAKPGRDEVDEDVVIRGGFR